MTGAIGSPPPATPPPPTANGKAVTPDLSPEIGRPGNMRVSYSTRGQPSWSPAWSDPNPALQFPYSVRVFTVMLRTDDQVDAVMRAVSLPILDAAWDLEETGVKADVAAFVRNEIGLPRKGEAMVQRRRGQAGIVWSEHVREAIDCLAYGFMPFEQVYSATFPGEAGHPDLPIFAGKPAIHLRKLGPRHPSTIRRIRLDRDGGLVSVFQYPPAGEPDWFNRPDGEPGLEIPVNRLLMYVSDRKGGDWSGVSILRTAYRPWKLKEQLIRWDAMSAERNSLGIPVVNYDPSMMSHESAMELATQARAGAEAGIAIPPGCTFSLVGVSGSVPDLGPKINQYNEAIGRASLAMFLNLGHDDGARSLGDTFLSFFTRSLQSIAARIGDTFTEHCIRDLVEWNFGLDEPYPRLVPGEINTEMALAPDAFHALVESKLIIPDDELEASIRRRYRLPDADTATSRKDEPPPAPEPKPEPPAPPLPELDPVTGLPVPPPDKPADPAATDKPAEPAGPKKNPFLPASLSGYAAFLQAQIDAVELDQ